jgi:hypothetical protein
MVKTIKAPARRKRIHAAAGSLFLTSVKFRAWTSAAILNYYRKITGYVITGRKPPFFYIPLVFAL